MIDIDQPGDQPAIFDWSSPGVIRAKRCNDGIHCWQHKNSLTGDPMRVCLWCACVDKHLDGLWFRCA